jgi:hypothetical protein
MLLGVLAAAGAVGAPSAQAAVASLLDPPASCLDYTRVGDELEVRLHGGNDVGIRGYRAGEAEGWRPVGGSDIVTGRLALFISSSSAFHGCAPQYVDEHGETRFATNLDGSGPSGVSYALEGVHQLRIVFVDGAEAWETYLPELARMQRELPGLHIDVRMAAAGGDRGGWSLNAGPPADAASVIGPAVAADRLRMRALGPGQLDLDEDGVADLTLDTLAHVDYFGIIGSDGGDLIDLGSFGGIGGTITTGSGDDHIVLPQATRTTGYFPVVHTNAGNDEIQGGGHGAAIDAGAGDDHVTAGAGVMAALLGDGADVASGGPASDWIEGGPGADVIGGGDGADTLHGDAGDDDLTGGALGDDLSGGDGNDVLRGDDGDDLLLGDAGRDRLLAGAGDDRLDGQAGADTLSGDAGNDRVATFGYQFGPQQKAPDHIDMGPGSDSIEITGGIGDVIDAGAGDDYVEHTERATIHAGTGNDYVALRAFRGGLVDLGPGADALIISGLWMPHRLVPRLVHVDCGAGRDWVDYQPVRPVHCEWQAQRDFWDLELGLPIRDDHGIPRRPPRPRDRGPRHPRPVPVKPRGLLDSIGPG